ncbi:MAG: hypothetical protein ACRDTQ_19955 [Micromonosporaceae bacterium]
MADYDGGSASNFGAGLLDTAHKIQKWAAKKREEEYVAEINDRLPEGEEPGTDVRLAPPSVADRDNDPSWKTWRADILAMYDWIPPLFERFTHPDPDSFDILIEDMEHAVDALGSVAMTRMDRVENELGEWKGHARESFLENIVEPFDGMNENHRSLALILLTSMKTNRKIFEVMQKNIEKIANQTLTHIKGLTYEGGGASGDVVLTMFSAVVSVFAAASTGGTSIALTAVSGAAGVASSLPGEEEKPLPLGANTVDDVLGNMVDAVSWLDSWIDHEERQIVGALSANHDLASNPSTRRAKFVPHRPANIPPGELRTGFQPPS